MLHLCSLGKYEVSSICGVQRKLHGYNDVWGFKDGWDLAGRNVYARAVHTLGLQNKKAWHKTMRRLRGSRDLVWLDHGRVERELQRQV